MIKFIKVTKQFADDQAALYEVSFEIEEGELVLITGPSGSGKTTLLKLLTKEYEITSGQIFFREESVTEVKGSQIPFLRRKIGAVFQDYKLLPELNVWENIALALSITHRSDDEIAEKVTDLLKLVDLEDKAYLFPHQLSGGEAQRISIARALSTAPEVIFADEPTGNLDAGNAKTIAKLLKKINELGTTVIITTHDPVVMEVLSGARQISLEKGKVKEDTKPSHSKKSQKKEEKEESTVIKEADSAETIEVKPQKTSSFFGLFSWGKNDKTDNKSDENPKVEVESLDDSEKNETSEKKKDKSDSKKTSKAKENK